VRPVVLDASAAVELVCRTRTGVGVGRLITKDSVVWVPDGIFDVEVNATLRRLELRGHLTTAQCSAARLRLGRLRLRRRRVADLADRAWSMRSNVTFPDACYVALAEALGCSLLTTDMKLAGAPTLPVETLHPPRD